MSGAELIELQDLPVKDRIELAAPPLPSTPRLEWANTMWRGPGKTPLPPNRVGTVRLMGDSVSLLERPGEGHHFQPCTHAQPTWCDLCGDFIWGLYKQSLRCAYCGFTCHYRCQALIQLDCSSIGTPIPDQWDYLNDSIETDTNVDEQMEWNTQDLSLSEVQQKVKEYNAQVNSNLFMVLVQFQLVRPVSVLTTEEVERGRDPGVKQRTSFYLPKDTVKHLHVSSTTGVRQVIQALLHKFTVADNPAKFALFQRNERQGQVCFRKLADDECPLLLRLCAGPSEEAFSLVLKENEMGEVNWDAFSVPELYNFLRILEREEGEHIKKIVQRYANARDCLQGALARSRPG